MLSSTAPAINPLTEPVTLQIGTFSTTFHSLTPPAAPMPAAPPYKGIPRHSRGIPLHSNESIS